MKKIYSLLVASFLFAGSTSLNAQQQTATFNYTGSVQTFTIPACVYSITVDVIGAKGGNQTGSSGTSIGGAGGRVQGTIAVNPGDVLSIYVGGQGGVPSQNLGGFNGGANGGSISYCAGGGGASDIRLNGTALSNRIFVGAGGGGAGTNCWGAGDHGGAGGGLVGAPGCQCNSCAGGTPNYPGAGGTQSAGGLQGNDQGQGCTQPGTLGNGGAGACTYGGGGGGGYYGGGGGGYGGGGGGSSYNNPSATSVTHTQAYNTTGNGSVVINYTPGVGVPATPGTITGSTSVCSGSTGNYSISSVPSATSYTWTVPSGAIINSGQGTTTINVTFGSTSGPITVTANNACGSSPANSLSITVDPTPVVNLGPNVSQCGGTVVLNAGNPGSTYAWSESSTTQQITVSTSGTYSVVVTSTAGCTGTDAIDININPNPVVNLGPDITQCGGTALLDAQNPGAFYSWSTGASTQTITVSTTSNYSVFVTDANGCTATDVISVTINPIPTVTFTLNPSTVCDNWPVYPLSGGSPSGGTYSGPGVTANNFDAASVGAGTYTITYSYTDPNTGCVGQPAQQQIIVTVCTGDQALTLNEALMTIYPNPTNGMLNIHLPNGMNDMTLEVIDLRGQLVFNERNLSISRDETHSIDVSSLANGVYFIKLFSGSELIVRKISIQK